MRSFALASMAVAVQAGYIANNLATVDDNRAVAIDKILRFPVFPKVVDNHRKNGKVRRQHGSELVNDKRGTQYLITLNMGEPGKDVQVDFDTGSSELWVNPDCSKAGSDEAEAFCEKLGKFQPGKSTVHLGTKGGVTYGKGEVEFDYVKDFVGLAGARIVNQTFGMATYSNDLNEGIMGAGPVLKGFDSAKYPMVIDSLAQQGITNGRAFSVDLRSVDNPRGAVIFGGADTKKFSGKLVKCPILVPGPDGAVRYWINMNGLTVNMPNGKTWEALVPGANMPIFPDTGATLSHLPRGLVDAIAAGFPGAEFDEQYNQHTVPCALRKQDKTIDFKFGDAVIKVPFADFIWEPIDDLCLLGAVPTSEDRKSWSLGDSFLRAAYAVFDQDNKNVWLAQSADCGTNLVSFDKGVNAVKPLEGECGKPPVTSSSTTTTTTSSTTSNTSSSTTTTTTTTTDVTTSSNTETSSVPTSTGTTSSSTGVTSSSTGVTSSSSGVTSSSTGVTTSSTGVTSSSTGVTTSSGTGITTTPVPTGTGSTSIPWTNMTTTAAPTYTSTFLTTTTYTITSCPPVVTNCPVGHVTTEVITSYTTWCPGEQTATNSPPKPTGGSNQCPGGPNCPGVPGKPEQPGSPLPVCPGPECTKPTGGNQCPGPNCPGNGKPTPGENKPTGGAQCPGAPNCPPQATSAGPKPTSPAGGSCPGGANCPHPTGGMSTVSKPCATCGNTVPTGKPTTPPVVTGAASEIFRVSGLAAVAAVMAALIL